LGPFCRNENFDYLIRTRSVTTPEAVPAEASEILPPFTSQEAVPSAFTQVAFTRGLTFPNVISTTSILVGTWQTAASHASHDSQQNAAVVISSDTVMARFTNSTPTLQGAPVTNCSAASVGAVGFTKKR